MNKIYKIVKRRPPEAVDPVATNSTSSQEPSALESVELETVPAPPEKLEERLSFEEKLLLVVCLPLIIIAIVLLSPLWFAQVCCDEAEAKKLLR